MKKPIVLLAFFSSHTFAADPMTSIYSELEEDTVESFANLLVANKKDGEDDPTGVIRFFKFNPAADGVLGSLSVGTAGDSQSIKFNAINYNLLLGNERKIPFQLYLSEQASNGGDSDSEQDVNTEALLDPESGIALKFPFLWSFQGNQQGICHFISDTNTRGHCSWGGDITFNFKELVDENGNSETAFGKTIRLGGGVLFPILDAKNDEEKGYVSISARAVYAHTDIDDSTRLFAPILDVNGDPIAFDNSIFSSELELKWSFDGKLAIAAKWLRPFDNGDYIDDLFKLTLETKFN